MTDYTARRQVFRALHESGTFLIPNPYDAGSAKLLAALGFKALASTSSGFAATLGRLDMNVTCDELVAHVGMLTAATEIPLNVDAERCFGETPEAVAETVRMLAAVGACGVSIEDWNPAINAIDPIRIATERVAAAADAARANGVMLTGRCENFLHGVTDLDDTIARLCAYRDAGAEVVYATGLADITDVRRIVEAVGVPVNVLLRPGGLTVAELGLAGVRRISVGGMLSHVAQGAMVAAAQSLLDVGQVPADIRMLSRDLARKAFAS